MPTDAPVHFDGREQARDLALSLVQLAKKRICFFGTTLDSVLFNNADCLEAISIFARRTPRAQAQFIVHNTQQALSQGHGLIGLTQKLTSSIQIRVSGQQHRPLTQYFLLIDDRAYLFGQHVTRYYGRVSFDDMSETRQLQQLFDQIWAHGHPDPLTRRLAL
jgi:hypothetical protein